MTAIVAAFLFALLLVSTVLLGAFVKVWLTIVLAGPHRADEALRRLERRQ